MLSFFAGLALYDTAGADVIRSDTIISDVYAKILNETLPKAESREWKQIGGKQALPRVIIVNVKVK